MRRVNRCVELLDQGQPVYYDRVSVTDLSYDSGRDLCGTWADFLRIEMEHQALDVPALYDFMRGLKDAGPTRSGHVTPAVFCTIPASGMSEDEVRANAWQIRHILGTGVHGLYLPHVRDPKAVRTFVEATRFPVNTIGVGPGLGVGTRGHGAEWQPAEIWGLDVPEYLRKADPWPLNPEGELILGVKIEDRFGLEHADGSMAVPGVTFGEWGPGDMGLFYGHPEWKDPPYEPEMEEAWRTVKAACDKAGIRWLCMWDDPAMGVQAKAEFLINDMGATLLASNNGEDMAKAGRGLTGRDMPA